MVSGGAVFVCVYGVSLLNQFEGVFEARGKTGANAHSATRGCEFQTLFGQANL